MCHGAEGRFHGRRPTAGVGRVLPADFRAVPSRTRLSRCGLQVLVQAQAIDQREKAGDISEDEKFTERETVQKLVDDTNKKLDEQYHAKEVEMAQ